MQRQAEKNCASDIKIQQNLMFIIDGVDRSGQSKNSYQRLINQIVNFIQSLSFGPDEIHLGMIWIGDKKNTFSKMTWSPTRLQRMIDFLKAKEMDNVSGHIIGSPTSDALRLTAEILTGHDVVFNRSQVPNLVVFFTNGVYGGFEFVPILKVAENLRQFAHVVTVGFGSFVKVFLNLISDCPGYTIKFDGLQNLQSQLALTSCE